MDQLIDFAMVIFAWLVELGVIGWLAQVAAMCVLLVGMVWVAWKFSELSRNAARAILWHAYEALFFAVPAVAVINGGWWWIAPVAVAISTGILIRIDEGDPVDPLMKRMQRRAH